MIYFRIGLIFLLLIVLSGCLYPEEQRRQNQAPYEDQLEAVQNAVHRFQENTDVLPIKTREAETPIFQKYPVDFSQLMPTYLENPPTNSFENGGVYQYVLVTPEETPTVKLIDLRTIRVIQDLERRIYQDRSEHQYAPVKEVVGNELLMIDYDQLNYDEEPTVESPFHPNHRLPLLLQTDGNIVIDYSMDIEFYLDEHDWGEYEEGDDLRWLLVDHSPFVPVHSLPQTIDNNEIKFITD